MVKIANKAQFEPIIEIAENNWDITPGYIKSGVAFKAELKNRPHKMPPKRKDRVIGGENKKRSRKAITLEKKLDVLRRLEAGEKLCKISKVLGLATSTVGTIHENKAKIIAQSQSAAPQSAAKLTRHRSNIMEKMENLLSIWIEDNNQRNIPMSTMMIQEKGKSLFEKLKIGNGNRTSESFNASKGWFEKFKNRHNSHNIKLKGKAASADIAAALGYRKIFKKIIDEGEYVAEQIFNVDETGLYWKRMPEKTYISKDEKCAPGYKVAKERLTLLLGGNAAGDFKLKPLLIYLSENPRALKGCNKSHLPVIWRSNEKAWMTSSLFESWFRDYFCPEVKLYLERKNLSNKVLLLLDNAPGHPVNLHELSDNVRIEYLPKNITAWIQPMDQGVISTFKAYYLQKTFKQLIVASEKDGQGFASIKAFWKNYNIKDAIQNFGESWKEIKPCTIKSAWKKIWPENVNNDDADVQVLPEVFQNIVNLGNQLGFENFVESDVTDLINDQGVSLSDDDLIQLEKNQPPGEHENKDNSSNIAQEFTTKDLSTALFHFEEGIKILREKDVINKRSLKVSRAVNEAIDCYKQLYKEKTKSATKQKLPLFFRLVPSTSANDTVDAIQISDTSSEADLNSESDCSTSS